MSYSATGSKSRGVETPLVAPRSSDSSSAREARELAGMMHSPSTDDDRKIDSTRTSIDTPTKKGSSDGTRAGTASGRREFGRKMDDRGGGGVGTSTTTTSTATGTAAGTTAGASGSRASASTTTTTASSSSSSSSSSTGDSRRVIGRWYIGETLGKGGYSWVKKGTDIRTGKIVALKFMDKRRMYSAKDERKFVKQMRQVKTEIEALKHLKHPNVVKLLAYNLQTKYPSRRRAAMKKKTTSSSSAAAAAAEAGSVIAEEEAAEESRTVILIVLEYMSGGELFDLLYYTSRLSEELARTYFRQLIAAIKACHSVGIVHRDIKPQNLLLNKRFQLKLTDFGLSKFVDPAALTDDGTSTASSSSLGSATATGIGGSERDGIGSGQILSTYHVGTKGYQCPEVLKEEMYGAKCDVFAAGVVLFILVTGYPPFEHATRDDPWYSNIANGEHKKFWKLHKGCGITLECAELITNMLLYRESDRASIAKIEKYPWFNDAIVEPEKLYKIISLKHRQMQIQRSRDPLKRAILQVSGRTTKKVMRSIDSSEDGGEMSGLTGDFLYSEDYEIEVEDLPDHMGISMVDVYTTIEPSMVMEEMVNRITLDKGSAQIDPHSYKGLFRYAINMPSVTDMRDGADDSATAMDSSMLLKKVQMVTIEVAIYSVPDLECYVVKFHRRSGSHKAYLLSLSRIRRDCCDVFTGLPKSLELREDEKALLTEYFAS